MARLQALGPYECASSSGESVRLDPGGWQRGPDLLELLSTLTSHDPPGDVYARIREGGPRAP